MFPSIFRLPGAFSDPPLLPRPLFPARDVDLPRLSALGRPDDPLPLHLLDDGGRAVETDLEPPLEHRLGLQLLERRLLELRQAQLLELRQAQLLEEPLEHLVFSLLPQQSLTL